ncbi:unnamed protein product [Camellia sinensis]
MTVKYKNSHTPPHTQTKTAPLTAASAFGYGGVLLPLPWLKVGKCVVRTVFFQDRGKLDHLSIYGRTLLFPSMPLLI